LARETPSPITENSSCHIPYNPSNWPRS
jgi:hypothetical protein